MRYRIKFFLKSNELEKHVVVRSTCTVPGYIETENTYRLEVKKDGATRFVTSVDNDLGFKEEFLREEFFPSSED